MTRALASLRRNRSGRVGDERPGGIRGALAGRWFGLRLAEADAIDRHNGVFDSEKKKELQPLLDEATP